MSDHLHALIPEPQPADLLEQLAQDQQTAGLAKLTQRLISALKIPMHSRASNDQSFGGVSDITNRGNFDRLLLSELAHDDLSLMVRLANNEALYLRREELPARHNRQRFVLIDTSIKMWGTPRIYAIATALAAINNSKAILHTFALQGSHYREINLSSAAGIKNTLNQLSPALDSADALTAFTKAFPFNRQQEYFLITDEQLFYTPAFQYAFANLRNAYGFLVTVSRTGQLQMFRYTGASRKLLHSLLLDLPALLRTVYNPDGLPAFLNITPAPLYFPTYKVLQNRGHLFEAFGVIAVTRQRRVLYWPDKNSGAREMIPCIIKGKYYFGHDRVSMIYILACAEDTNRLVLYKIGTAARITKEIECLHNIKTKREFSIVFEDEKFLIDTGEALYFLNPTDNKTKHGPELELCEPDTRWPVGVSQMNRFDINQLKRNINNGHSAFNNVKQIYIRDGRLKIDNREIAINDTWISIVESPESMTSKSLSAKGPEVINLPDLDYKLLKFVFPDGSEVVIDSRGLLHLRSADKNLKEVTVLLILGKHTACWASDGKVCGSEYFIVNRSDRMNVQEFYTNYIQSFIHALS